MNINIINILRLVNIYGICYAYSCVYISILYRRYLENNFNLKRYLNINNIHIKQALSNIVYENKILQHNIATLVRSCPFDKNQRVLNYKTYTHF